MKDDTYIEVDERHRIRWAPSSGYYPQKLAPSMWYPYDAVWRYYSKKSGEYKQFGTEQAARIQ